MKWNLNGSAELYLPDQPLIQQNPFLILGDYPLKDREQDLDTIKSIATQTFRALEYAWGNLGCRLADFKVEFGVGSDGTVLLADVIDNDSWRVVKGKEYIDKQVYRDGASLEDTLEKYRHVAMLTSQF